MGAKSKIEWTDCTDNIIVVKGGGWWCRKISPGCENCYAAALNQSSFFGGNKLAYTGQPPELELRREVMAGWARQTKPRKHFVSSMTDVFGEWVPPEWAFEMLDAMTAAPRQTFQVLTKRPGVARRYIAAWLKERGRDRLPDNVWMGTTVEDQTRAEERIPELIGIPARVRFLSCEPLLGPVDLSREALKIVTLCEGTGQYRTGVRIHWVIAGGESGNRARPMHPAWVRSLRDQCVKVCNAARVPFFFKQWGEWRHCDEMPSWEYAAACSRNCRHVAGPGNGFLFVGKHKAGRTLDGREWSEFPTSA